MKLIASLIILGLCANLCFGATTAPTATTQSSAIASTSLNSTAIKVYSAANTTDAAVWNPCTTSSTATACGTGTNTGVPKASVIFGPGTANTTSYVYGWNTASNKFTNIYKRTLNNTVVGWGNDTTMASVSATDATIGCVTPASSVKSAVGPGYLALLSTGTDTQTPASAQVYVNLVTGTSATEKKITTNLDVVYASGTTDGKTTTYSLGNIWYDKGTGAFFFTYASLYEFKANGGSTSTFTNYIFLQGIYTNGTTYWTTPLTVQATMATPAASTFPLSIIGGGDNYLNSTNIYIMYQDGTPTLDVVYLSKTAKATTTTAVGAFSAIATDVAYAAGPPIVSGKTYTPLAVWASNYTYGVAVGLTTQTGATTYTYNITNYLNGTTTATDSGLSYSSANSVAGASGWLLTTGYSLFGAWGTTTSDVVAYTFGTFYANGTVNSTQVTLGTLQGPVGFYEDVNGTMWAWWTDVDTTNSLTYAGYLAKFQGQVNVASGANTLTTILAFVALLFAAIFAF